MLAAWSIATALGNIGWIEDPATPGVEASGLAQATIVRERLTLDARPLGGEANVIVEATYELAVAEPIQASLGFVTGSSDFSMIGVTLDGEPVPFAREHVDVRQPSWQPPEATPGLGGGPLGYDVTSMTEDVVFAVTLDSGPHTLTVRYNLAPRALRIGEPTSLWQLVYILAPARNWGGFGRLDIELRVPEGWHVAVEPALERDGDVLRGSFDGLPGDHLAATLQLPTPPLHGVLVVLGPATWILVTLAGPAGLLGITVRALHLVRRRRWAAVAALQLLMTTAAVGWVFAMLIATGFAFASDDLLVPELHAGVQPSYSVLVVGLVVSVAAPCLALGAVAGFQAVVALATRVRAADPDGGARRTDPVPR